ncbi:MAG: acetate--CoA ligase family protein [Dehalococcoidales bacterium]|nr:acetate--CoA ligase family protein [Dehalococcoidales bacterium]
MTTPLTMHTIIERARNEGRVVLTEVESKELLGQSGISVIDTGLAASRSEAVAISQQLGFPVVLKIASPDIVHKSDAGGVRLELENPGQVERAYDEILRDTVQKHPGASVQGVSVQKMATPGVEVIIGMSQDVQFGPVLMFGLGGVWVEILEDVSLRVIPVTRRDVREMVKEIKGYRMLTGYRGLPPVDESKLEDMLLAVADFATQYPMVKELDLNPVIAYSDRAIVVDARVVLEDTE